MKVRCYRPNLHSDDEAWLIMQNSDSTSVDEYLSLSSLQIGQEYLVYGVIISHEHTFVIVDLGDVRWSYEPLMLFEVTDSRLSRYWQIYTSTDGEVEIIPAMLIEHPHLLEQAGDDEPKAMEQFRFLIQTPMRAEFDE